MVMTSTQQAARAAAQLHEAAQDVAHIAARRRAEAEGRIAELPMQQEHELTEDLAAEAREAPGVCGSEKKSKLNEALMPSRRPRRHAGGYCDGKDDPR
jgi:hypothetical protein